MYHNNKNPVWTDIFLVLVVIAALLFWAHFADVEANKYIVAVNEFVFSVR